MAKYLVRGSYMPEGAEGLLKDGGSKRKAVIEGLMKSVGGTIDSFYFAFGETDVYIVADLPDRATATALSVVTNASGAVAVSVTPLITVEEMDEACKKQVAYTPPGQ